MTELLDAIVETKPAVDPAENFQLTPSVQQKLIYLDSFSKAINTPPGVLRIVQPVSCKISTFWGDIMNVILPEAVSSEIAISGTYENELTVGFIQLIEAGSTVFDIGAHRGYFTMLAARLAGPTGQVHAFEPTPSTFQLLESNAGTLPGVHLNNTAVYSETTDLVLHDFGLMAPAFNSIYKPRLSDAQATKLFTGDIRVKAVSIDDYVAATGTKPDFIKIDAESAETDILKGMRHVLETIRPAFTLETGDMSVEGVSSTRELIDLACSFEYTPIEMKNGAFSIHQKQTKYAYGNLLFVANEKASY